MALTIRDYRLPAELEDGAQGGPERDDDIQEAITGQEVANQRWLTCRHRYTLNYAIEQSNNPVTNYNKVRHLFMVHGKIHPFRFRQPGPEGSAVNQQFGVGDGAATQFQLSLLFDPQMALDGTPGTLIYRHPIYLLQVGTTPTIRVAGSPTTAFTLGDTAMVTFASAPANGASLNWDGIPHLAMRFDVDRLPIIYSKGEFAKIGQIAIRELVGTREITA